MLLEKYQDNEINDFSDTKILQLRPFDEYGSPMNIVKLFGGKENYIKAVEELENELYAS
jgi:type I restriction enzyme R subunit